ncbi:hypothetical protein SO802_027120 [Lithocarpus litseifolius]|uniref:DUF4283 domain-containing protein n=1 Tax=Lithocarpus litseifolius TaxID=425828 RepID=A0AAW2C1I6_9ROSI
MAEELEQLWKKLSFTKEKDEDIVLGENSTKTEKELGKNCLVIKILTQRCINIEALRKTMRMLWKTNKTIQISEIEEELFLVELSDPKDKKKILEMCPWSFEKNLVLLQEFSSECPEKGETSDGVEKEKYQYEAWLRAEPMKSTNYSLETSNRRSKESSQTMGGSWKEANTAERHMPHVLQNPSLGAGIVV